MGYGNHFGTAHYAVYFLIFILVSFSILAFKLLITKPLSNQFLIKLLGILKEKYASGEITEDEFIERKSIIEDIEYTSQYTPMLLDRYANCLVSTKELLNIKNEIENMKLDNNTCEKLAKGELSFEEFKAVNM